MTRREAHTGTIMHPAPDNHWRCPHCKYLFDGRHDTVEAICYGDTVLEHTDEDAVYGTKLGTSGEEFDKQEL